MPENFGVCHEKKIQVKYLLLKPLSLQSISVLHKLNVFVNLDMFKKIQTTTKCFLYVRVQGSVLWKVTSAINRIVQKMT